MSVAELTVTILIKAILTLNILTDWDITKANARFVLQHIIFEWIS